MASGRYVHAKLGLFDALRVFTGRYLAVQLFRPNGPEGTSESNSLGNSDSMSDGVCYEVFPRKDEVIPDMQSLQRR